MLTPPPGKGLSCACLSVSVSNRVRPTCSPGLAIPITQREIKYPPPPKTKTKTYNVQHEIVRGLRGWMVGGFHVLCLSLTTVALCWFIYVILNVRLSHRVTSLPEKRVQHQPSDGPGRGLGRSWLFPALRLPNVRKGRQRGAHSIREEWRLGQRSFFYFPPGRSCQLSTRGQLKESP